MTARASLELKGIVRAFPTAEVLREIAHAGLSGSLRVEMGEQKTVIYFIDGAAAYAVSNEKKFRLAKILYEHELIDKDFLAQNRNLVGDLLLAEKIEADARLSGVELNRIISELCVTVVGSMLRWPEGEWAFSPHARLKTGVRYELDLPKILITYGRDAPADLSASRISNPNEWFARSESIAIGIELREEEAFVLSRLDAEPITLGQLLELVGEAVTEPLGTIYSLWLGGFLTRHGWQAAFSDERISYLKSAELELKKPARVLVAQTKAMPEPKPMEHDETGQVDTDAPFDLEENLSRIESAENSYEVLGISASAKTDDIRKAYYRLAKMLHPDRYRRESEELLRRVEKAFTELSQAHESIKIPEARQRYDTRMRDIEREKKEHSQASDGDKDVGQAAGDFERGFALQLEGEFEAAIPFLARAAYYEPRNARYRAYYGKALTADGDQRHKAEKELVTAIQLEPENPVFRLMLVEFLIKYKLLKRAQGELNRLLEISPGHKDALRMLDRLRAN